MASSNFVCYVDVHLGLDTYIDRKTFWYFVLPWFVNWGNIVWFTNLFTQVLEYSPNLLVGGEWL